MEVYKRRKSDQRPLWCYFLKTQCKNGSLNSRDPHRALASCVLPFSFPQSCPSLVGSYQPYHLPFQRRPFRWESRPIGSTFVTWRVSTGSSDQVRLIFRCVQSRDFNLVKGCGIYFPKCCPNSVLFFFSCLLGLRWLLNALNYAGSLCIFKHLCVIQITGGHRAWLTGQLRLRNGEIPRNLTMDRVLGGWVAA